MIVGGRVSLRYKIIKACVGRSMPEASASSCDPQATHWHVDKNVESMGPPLGGPVCRPAMVLWKSSCKNTPRSKSSMWPLLAGGIADICFSVAGVFCSILLGSSNERLPGIGIRIGVGWSRFGSFGCSVGPFAFPQPSVVTSNWRDQCVFYKSDTLIRDSLAQVIVVKEYEVGPHNSYVTSPANSYVISPQYCL